MISVLVEGLVVVPYLPIMRVSKVLVVRIDKSTKRNGRGVDIGDLGAYILCDVRNNTLEELDVNGYAKLLHLGLCAACARLDLVVTADDSKAGMVTESFKVLSHLGNDVIKHLLIGHNERTCKSEVEEYDKTELVTNIEEVVVGIIAATPYSYSIEVSEYASLK